MTGSREEGFEIKGYRHLPIIDFLPILFLTWFRGGVEMGQALPAALGLEAMMTAYVGRLHREGGPSPTQVLLAGPFPQPEQFSATAGRWGRRPHSPESWQVSGWEALRQA